MKLKVFLIFALAIFFISANANADPITYGFYNITNNNPSDAAIGEAQLFVDVSGAGSQATFHFYNTGPVASIISEIYFDDGSLLSIASIINAPAPAVVLFQQDANPPDLPGGNSITPQFNVTAGFLAEAVNPEPQYGVGPGEWVEIIFQLQNGKTLNDVLDDLNDGSLRIGIHVKSFASGGSESFVNTPIPEPATMLLLGSGLLGLAGFARRRFKR